VNMRKELSTPDDQENLVVAQLAVAFTLLALAPFDSWGHQGSPAAMAAFVVKTAKERGNFGFVIDMILPSVFQEGKL
jgi:hypothetical protein